MGVYISYLSYGIIWQVIIGVPHGPLTWPFLYTPNSVPSLLKLNKKRAPVMSMFILRTRIMLYNSHWLVNRTLRLACSIVHMLTLVMYGFKDSTGVKVPNESFNSSSDSSLNRSRSELCRSIRMGFDSILTCSSIIGQLDCSRISSGLSSHSIHSKPKHLFGALLRLNIFSNCRVRIPTSLSKLSNIFLNSYFLESWN